jgi:hypothetical protein
VSRFHLAQQQCVGCSMRSCSLIDFPLSSLLCLQKRNKCPLCEASTSLGPERATWGEHKTSLAVEPGNSHPQDGGPVCLLPCLKSSMGLLLPSSCPLCMWNTVKKLPWHFSDFVAWNAQCSSLERPLLLPATSHSTIPDSKVIRSGCTPQCPEGLQNLPCRFQSSPSTWSHWIMRKASHWTARPLIPTEDKENSESFEYSACPLVYNVFFFFNEFKGFVQRVNVLSI